MLFAIVSSQTRVLKNDFARYNVDDEEDDLDSDDNGWKIIHTDVFRFPVHKNIFCAILGEAFLEPGQFNHNSALWLFTSIAFICHKVFKVNHRIFRFGVKDVTRQIILNELKNYLNKFK